MKRRALEPDPVRRWVGYALTAVGVLTMATAGLCSMSMLGAAALSSSGDRLGALVSASLMVAVFGGLPVFVGWLVFGWGRTVVRPPPPIGRQSIANWTGDDDAT